MWQCRKCMHQPVYHYYTAYLDALFRVLADADVGLVFRSAQQVQDVLVVYLELQTPSIDKPSA